MMKEVAGSQNPLLRAANTGLKKKNAFRKIDTSNFVKISYFGPKWSKPKEFQRKPRCEGWAGSAGEPV